MKKLINFRPIIYLVLSLCMGILTAYSFTLGKIALGVISILVFVTSTLLLWLLWKGDRNRNILDEPKRLIKPKLILSVVALVLAVIGGLNLGFTVKNYNDAGLGGRTYKITGKITEIQPSEYGTACIISNVNYSGTLVGKTDYKILLYVTGENSLDIGDNVTFTTRLTDRNFVYDGKFSSHYVSEKIKFSATVSASIVTVNYQSRTVFEKINVFIRDTLKLGLGEKEFSVAYALLCGNSEYMESEIITNFRASGVAHIFAVSGLHIGFFAVVLNFITTKLRFNKYLRFGFILAVLILYCGACGFTASSIRATVMTAVMLFAEILGKKYDGLSAVATAGLGILIFAPVQLFCVGFQLSFGVVLGISVLSRPIAKLFKFLPNKIASSLGVVLSAQIFGIPISLATFGEFSLIAIIANLIFIPFVGVIYILLLVTTLIGGIFGIPVVALFVPNYIFKFIIILITAFDYRIFVVGGFSFFWFNGLYYLAFTSWSDRLNLKLITRIIACSLSVVTFSVGVALANVFYKRDAKLVAVGTDNACVTLISSNHENVLLVNDVSSYFTNSCVKKVLNRVGESDIDALVIANNVNSPDVQVIYTLLWRDYKIPKVYYFDNGDINLQKSLEKSFSGISFTPISDGEVCAFDSFTVRLELDGYCAVVKTENSLAYLFSEFGFSTASYLGLDLNPTLIVATDYEETIYTAYKPDRLLCYRDSVYENTRSQGSVMIKI